MRVLLVLLLFLSGTLISPFGADSAGAAEVVVPYEWYRYQGEADSGPDANYNCEVTSTAMAIQLVRGGLRVPVRDVRAVIGHGGPTVTADAKRALRYWGVQTNDIDTIDQVVDAVRRGRVVIVGLMLGAIAPGEDLGQPRSSTKQRTGRYSAYAGAHSIVVRGVSADGQWLTVLDPNHWEGNPAYLYSDSTPKGKDRLYRTSEVAAGMRALVDFPRALEVIGTNAPLPASVPTQAKPVGTPSVAPFVGRPLPRQSSDLTALVSGGGSWSSAVLTFGVKNDGNAAITFDAIGIRGTKPDGKLFEALQRSLTLGPGEERILSLLIDTPDNGEWQITGAGFRQSSTWTDLPAEGRLNKATFRVGGGIGVPPRPSTTPAPGLKPGGSEVPRG